MVNKLKRIISEIIEVDEDQIIDEFGPSDATSWDSMNNLRIITALEEEFNIQLSMKEIETMINCKIISKLIEAKLSGRKAA
jgi:acyl carrier protein